MSDRHKLTWAASAPPKISQRPLPEEIKREFITSPDGLLELLVCLPRGETVAGRPPLLFVHGGFGTATAYMNFLPFFASHGFPSYSVSLRGHGASHNPGFWGMFWTTKHTLALDIVAAVEHICAAHDLPTVPSPSSPSSPASSVVLIGHSSGGGLAQYILAYDLAPAVGSMVALAAVPGFGSSGVYWNWLCMDPWSVPRLLLRDWGHPRSPLSSTALVHRAFFSDAFPSELVRAVEEEMPETESIAWPVGMFRKFVEPKEVVRGGRRVLVVAGGEDRIMGVGIMEGLAAWLRGAVEGEKAGMVEFEVVEGSGHDLMRDLEWEECARVVLEWLEGR